MVVRGPVWRRSDDGARPAIVDKSSTGEEARGMYSNNDRNQAHATDIPGCLPLGTASVLGVIVGPGACYVGLN